MKLVISLKVKLLISSLAVAAVLLLAASLGYGAGKISAQSFVIAQAAAETNKALQNFYSDQDRYPSAVEFENSEIMLKYLSSFPLPDFPSASCPRSFDYKRSDSQNFQLSFCLPSSSGAYDAGWNAYSNSKPAVN